MRSNKIFLFPGYGEDAYIFDKLRNDFSNYILVNINYRKPLSKYTLLNTNVDNLANAIIEEYGITSNDTLLGHSLGGFISLAIQSKLDNKVILVSSFCDTNKIRRITYNKSLTYLYTITNFIKSKIVRDRILKTCKGKYYEEELMKSVDNFKTYSGVELTKLSIISFSGKLPFNNEKTIFIHAKDDRIVSLPDDKFFEVKGSHFTHIFDKDNVLKIINNWI